MRETPVDEALVLAHFLKQLIEADDPLSAPQQEQLMMLRMELQRSLKGDWKREMTIRLILELLKMAFRSNRVAFAALEPLIKEIESALGESASDTSQKLQVRGWTPVLYRVSARHKRLRDWKKRGFHSDFRSGIPAVRVKLPKTEPAVASRYDTSIGEVRSDDHVVFSVEKLYEAYERTFTQHDHGLGKPHHKLSDIKSAELITGGRRGTHRFCPVSIYFAYGANQGKGDAGRKEVLFYAVQSANFYGQEARLYVAKSLFDNPIIARSGFEPTPFSHVDHGYRFWIPETRSTAVPGRFSLNGQLYTWSKHGQSHEGDLVKYMDMTMRFRAVDAGNYDREPVNSQAEAYARVCRLEDRMRKPHHAKGPIQDQLHDLAAYVGRKQSWSW